MEVTDIRMRLINDRTDRLKAFCTVTFDEEFVIRDVKVVEGPEGFFIAMPSRKLSAACPSCRHKNQVRARFCEECGKKLKIQAVPKDPATRTRLYRDIAHPITPAFREKLQTCIIDAYREECENLPEEDDESDVDFEEDRPTSQDAEDTTASDDTEDATSTEAADDDDTDDDTDDDDTDATEDDGLVGETDQYSSLIADLKGGPGPSASGGSRSPRSSDRAESDRSPRRRRPRHEERPAQQESEAPEPADEASAESALTEPDDLDKPGLKPTASEPDPEPAPATRPYEPEPETADQAFLAETEAEPAGSEDASEDTATPFGAGIV